MKPRKRPATSDGLEILYRRYYEGRPDRIAALEEAHLQDVLACEIFELRTEAGLTQAQLAKKMGTDKSVICRLENADYDGHSLPTLRKIGEVLGYKLELRFVPTKRGRKTHIVRLAPAVTRHGLAP